MLRFLTILSALLSALRVAAGPDTSSFLHFSLSNGFPSNNVYSLTQDKNGFLWFATDNGVVKYNGYSFDVYNTDRGLPANDVWELFADDVGRLWIKSFSYKFGYIRNGKYKGLNYKSQNGVVHPEFLLSRGDLLYFTELSDKSFNICIANDDILRSFRAGIDNKKLTADSSLLLSLTITGRAGINLWTDRGNLYELRNTAGGYMMVLKCTLPEELLYLFTSKLSYSPGNDIFVFKMNGNVISRYNTDNCSYKVMPISEFGADKSERIYAFNPYYLNGNSAPYTSIVTTSHIYTLTPDMVLQGRQRHSDLIPSSSQVAYRMQDKEGNTWITTNSDGVFCQPLEYDFYKQLHKLHGLENARYAGHIGNVLYFWDSKGFTLLAVAKNKVIATIGFRQGITVYSISGNERRAYISSTDGIYEFDPKTQSLVDVNDRYDVRSYVYQNDNGDDKISSRVALEKIRKIQFTGEDIYGLPMEGITRYHFDGNMMICSHIERDRHIDIFHNKITNTLYSYSSKRIFIRDLATDKDEVISDARLESHGIGNIKSLQQDEQGNIFILDDNNIFVCDKTFNSVRKIKTDFLLSDAFMQVRQGRLYLAGNFGLAYMEINGNRAFSNFFLVPNRGLNFFKRPEGLVVSGDGYALFKTNEGMHHFHVDSLDKYATEITPDRHFFHLVLSHPFETLVTEKDTFRFRQTEERMGFNAINYAGHGSVTYSYRISGEAEPRESSSGEIFLGSLVPGRYYKVECILRDALWSSSVFTFYIYRHPYWWQTAAWKMIFWITSAILLVALVLVTMLITRHYVARKNERKRALTELELRAIHSQINPHFIFNTLSASLFFISKKRFDDAYDHVSKFSRLLRSYLKSSQDRYVILEEEIGMLRNYIELQQIRFEEKFEYSIEIDNKLPVANIRIPSLLLQPLVENAINHGLFHKGEGGRLLIRFLQGADSTELVCIIDDNGIGRDAAGKIDDGGLVRESYGTKLTNQLLEVFKLYEQYDISLKYTDKVSPESGTIVTLLLKDIKYVA